jgi:ribosomal protein S12 methylthiotransferase accessory factor
MVELQSAAFGPVRSRHAEVDEVGLCAATARLQLDRGTHTVFCHGRGLRPADAGRVAMCEALERVHIFHGPGEPLVHGSYADVADRAVDPRELFIGTYAGQPTFSDLEPIYWTWAWELPRGRARLVPAQEIWFRTGAPGPERQLVAATSNACALGGSFEEAALFAILEAVERDAYLIGWYLRRSWRRIDLDAVRLEPFQLLRRRWEASYPGYGLCLFDATTDTGIPAVAGVAVRHTGDGPRTFHSAAARLSTDQACLVALKDLCGFRAQLSPERQAELRPLLDEPGRVRTPEDHYHLFALEESFERLAFLDLDPASPGIAPADVDQGAVITPAEQYDLRDLLVRVSAHLEGVGVSVLLKDITHSELAGFGQRCVRAFTPGLFPLWFGYGEQRFALTERLRRLAHDYTGRDITDPRDCNLEMHPFS